MLQAQRMDINQCPREHCVLKLTRSATSQWAHSQTFTWCLLQLLHHLERQVWEGRGNQPLYGSMCPAYGEERQGPLRQWRMGLGHPCRFSAIPRAGSPQSSRLLSHPAGRCVHMGSPGIGRCTHSDQVLFTFLPPALTPREGSNKPPTRTCRISPHPIVACSRLPGVLSCYNMGRARAVQPD